MHALQRQAQQADAQTLTIERDLLEVMLEDHAQSDADKTPARLLAIADATEATRKRRRLLLCEVCREPGCSGSRWVDA